MSENSKIEWTDHTANFWWGCQKVSAGCTYCYADGLARRWGKNIWGPSSTTERELKTSIWENVEKWDRDAGQRGERACMFTMSMGDFFEDHPEIASTRDRAMDLLESLQNIDVQLLTKRPENVPTMARPWMDKWPAHIWLGTSVEDQSAADSRIPELCAIPAATIFLSVEPLIGPVDLDLIYYPVDWVIVGGESGPNARRMWPAWVRSIRNQCKNTDTPFFFKQWGEFNADGHRVGKARAGFTLDGEQWHQYPGVRSA